MHCVPAVAEAVLTVSLATNAMQANFSTCECAEITVTNLIFKQLLNEHFRCLSVLCLDLIAVHAVLRLLQNPLLRPLEAGRSKGFCKI